MNYKEAVDVVVQYILKNSPIEISNTTKEALLKSHFPPKMEFQSSSFHRVSLEVYFTRNGLLTRTEEGVFDQYIVSVNHGISGLSTFSALQISSAALHELSDLCAKVSQLGKDIQAQFNEPILEKI